MVAKGKISQSPLVTVPCFEKIPLCCQEAYNNLYQERSGVALGLHDQKILFWEVTWGA